MGKQKEIKTKKVIVRPYYDWPFAFNEIEENAKMYGTQRLSSVLIVDDTEENHILALEYNKIHESIINLKNKSKDIIGKMSRSKKS